MGDMTPEQRAARIELGGGLTEAACEEIRDDIATAIRDAEERGRLAERLRIAAGIGFMASEYEDAGRDDAAKAARGLDKWVRSLGDAAIRAAGERESDHG